MEVINYLLGYKDLKIVQNTEYFNFSLDSVLLANFVTIRSNTNKIMDLGTGNAPIPLILSTKTKAQIYGVEIQDAIYKLALKTISINRMEEKIKLLNEDIKTIDKLFETDSFDIITSNPPYFKITGGGLVNNSNHKTIARHEVLMTIDDVLGVSRKLLKNNGILGLVHRPERLLEILTKMKKYNIEPKRIRFVYPKVGMNCNMILIEGSKNGKEGLKIMPPLFVHDKDGKYTTEVEEMFGA
ncbi:MAG: tRNA1(Val) (adenine(37)-N6)-methyltransferase [Bacilli bacterium]|nr:tRNA1(Val) (adenine(37)-N6)-methyltransferase [Bacilli bacterium]MDD4298036.1 tRNA1(Val) (adenine(37)-N6)-methyltransferase [Bacilli bacterium]